MADQNGHRDPATPEEIWNILRELAQGRKETDRQMQETDRRMQRQKAETDRQMQETRAFLERLGEETDRRMQETARQMQETDRQMQETDRRMQRQKAETDLRLRKLDELFNGQWGKLMESLVEGDLVNLLNRRGVAVDHTTSRARKDYGERRWEFDILAVNGEEVVVVEVKTTLKVPDVDYFLERMQDFPELMREYADRRIYGAVAYLQADVSVTVHAGRQGLYVIRATGSSASIINADGFTPRTFGRRKPVTRHAR